MSIITETAAGGGTQFAYTTAFGDTGSRWSKTQINTVAFSTGGAITSWTLSLCDEDGVVLTTIATSTTTSLYYSIAIGPLPVTDDGASYNLKFATVGMADPGTLIIDWQVARTGAT